MAALRIVLLALAVGIIGLLISRATPPHGGASPTAPRNPRDDARLASLERAMAASPAPPPVPTIPSAPDAIPASPAVPASPALPAARSADRAPDVPEFLGFYGRLRADFPRDYAAISGRDGAARPDAAIWDALRDLEQADGVLAAQAGPAALDRFFDARSAVLAGLAPLDPHRCVDFLYGVTDAGIADFTASHRGLVASLADRTLDAVADGRSHHVERPAPTEADLESLSAGLAAFGLAPAEIGLLIDGTTPDPPPPDRRVCEIGRTYLDVLHGLPADTRARIYGLAAQLLARS